MGRFAMVSQAVLTMVVLGLRPADADPPASGAKQPPVAPLPPKIEPAGPFKDVFAELAAEPEEKHGNLGMPWRTGATKGKLPENGGNEASERGVALGLSWLAKQQRPDGSWVFDGSSKGETTAATGLALLTFLGVGESHIQAKKYQKTVSKGLNWLLTHLREKGADAGKFYHAGTMYGQAIGTMALCEAYALSRDGRLRVPTQAAVKYIQEAQTDIPAGAEIAGIPLPSGNGSWGYQKGTPGDTSITGWQIQALHAARLCKDIEIKDSVFKKANAFLDTTAGGSHKSMYGYVDNAGARPGTSLTAVGVLCRYNIDGWTPDSDEMADAVAQIVKLRTPDGKKALNDLYFYYYATQLVRYHGGEPWDTWNQGPKGADDVRTGGVRDWLAALQLRKEGVNQGSWDPENGIIGKYTGRLGTTALCVLTLEVYYRYLPLHKRGAGPKDKK